MSDVAELSPQGTLVDDSAATLLIFTLSGENFGLAVSVVHEILDPIPRTPVPNTHELAPAVINVRGSVVPLLNIRTRLKMPRTEDPPNARIVVLEVEVQGAPTKVAISADSVDEVIDTDLTSLHNYPELGARWPRDLIQGIARHNGELVVLLNTETLFKPDQKSVKSKEISS